MMRIILGVLMCLVAATTLAQFPVQQNFGSRNTQINTLGAMAADSGFVYRHCFTDTVAANRGYLKNIPGIKIRTCNDTLWLRNNTATKWVLAAGGGGGSIYVDTVYTRNDSLFYLKNAIEYFVGVIWAPSTPGTDTLFWKIGGNDFITYPTDNPLLGTLSNHEINFITSGQTRLILPADGLLENTGDSTMCLSWDSISKRIYWVNCADRFFSCPPNQNILNSGGIVGWDSLLVFFVGPANYCILGNSYQTTTTTHITLSPADPALPRIDIIGLDATGVIIIEGTPAANPAEPNVLPDQIRLVSVFVGAGAITPGGVIEKLIYDENTGTPTEWNTSSENVTVDFDNTTNPFHFVKAANVGTVTETSKIIFTSDTQIILSNYDVLLFALYLNAPMPNSFNFQVYWTLNGIRYSQNINISDGRFGYSRNSSGVYQQISIPVYLWLPEMAVDKVDALVISANTTNINGFYIDYVRLQGGLSVIPFQIYTFRNGLTEVQPGVVELGGELLGQTLLTSVNGAGYLQMAGARFMMAQDITPLNVVDKMLMVGSRGNLFIINSSDTINIIEATGWYHGAIMGFICMGSPYFIHGEGTSRQMILNGRKNYQASPGDFIAFWLGNSGFYEIGRSSATGGEHFFNANLNQTANRLHNSKGFDIQIDSIGVLGLNALNRIRLTGSVNGMGTTPFGELEIVNGYTFLNSRSGGDEAYLGLSPEYYQLDLVYGIGDFASVYAQSTPEKYLSLHIKDAHKESQMMFYPDSIKLMPNNGVLNIDSLRQWVTISDTLHKKPMTWDKRNGRWEYLNYWPSGISGITADNGLTANTATNVQLGGTLINPITSINNASNVLYIGDGASTYESTIEIGPNYAIHEYKHPSSVAKTGLQMYGSDANFYLFKSTLSGFKRASINLLEDGTNAITDIYGKIRLHDYGDGAFTSGTPTYTLQVDASGNIIEGSVFGGYTFTNGLTESPAGTVKLGGTLTGNTTIAGGEFGLSLTGTSATVSTLNISNNSIGAGSIVNISSTSTAAASNLQKGLSVELSGANSNATQTTYAVYASNMHTGSTPTNYAIYGIIDIGSNFGSAIRGDNATGTAITGVGGTIGVRGSSSLTAVQGESSGLAISGIATSTGIAVRGTSVDGVAVRGIRNPSSTNTVLAVMDVFRNTTGTAASGIGASIDFGLEVSDGTTQISNRIISKLTDATLSNYTSQFIITGVNNGTTGDILTLNGNKSVRFNGYGSGTFTGTAAYALHVDASGNIIEGAISGGGGSGTVTSVSAGTGMNFTTITTSGAVHADTLVLATRAWRQKGDDSLAAIINTKLNISDTAAMLANYLRGATAGWGINIAGGQHKTWTADSLRVASWGRLYKAIDSIANGNNNYIQNQFAGSQTADYYVTGQFRRQTSTATTEYVRELFNNTTGYSLSTKSTTFEDREGTISMFWNDDDEIIKFATGEIGNLNKQIVMGKTGIKIYPAQSNAATHYFGQNSSGYLTLRTSAQVRSDIGAGTVTSFSFTDGNGFDGTVTNATTTPTLSLTTTVANKAFMFSNSGAIAGSTMLTQETNQVLLTGAAAAATTPFVVNAHEDLTGYITQFKQSDVLAFGLHSNKAFYLSETTAPPTPSSGLGALYVKSSDSKIYFKSDTGTEYDLTATAGGGITVGSTTITGGADKRVPFNDNGVYGEDSGLSYTKATNTLQVGVDGGSDGGAIVIESAASSYPFQIDRGGSYLNISTFSSRFQIETDGNSRIDIIGGAGLLLDGRGFNQGITFQSQSATVATWNISNTFPLDFNDYATRFQGTVRNDKHIEVKEIAAPATPPSDYGRLYAKTDGKIYFKNDDGTEYDLTGGGGSGLADPGSNGIVVRTALNTTTARSISGTTNRITVTNDNGVDGNPTIDISSSYVGQTSITTLGTISTGTWNGSVISGQYGGTGVANTGKTITVSGNTTIGSSTHTVTFQTSGNTDVTLPTGGTLAGWKSASETSNATPTPSGDAKFNYHYITALAANATFAAPSGTASNGNEILIRVKDNGTSRTLAWNSIYRAGTNLSLPTATTANRTMYIKFAYNSADSVWDLIAVLDGL